jgi:hypothetical protein
VAQEAYRGDLDGNASTLGYGRNILPLAESVDVALGCGGSSCIGTVSLCLDYVGNKKEPLCEARYGVAKLLSFLG